MTQMLLDTVELDLNRDPRLWPNGLLNSALRAPSGWHQGISVPFASPISGVSPQGMTPCPTAPRDTPTPVDVQTFTPFTITQGSQCSTLGRLEHEAYAELRLAETLEMGLANQFAMDLLNTGNPSLKDAMPIGTYAVDHLAAIIANLEMTFSDISGGSPCWIHTSILGSTLLFAEHLMRDGKTATGAPVVISPGYPSWDGEGSSAPNGYMYVQFWATGPVYVGLDDPTIVSDINRDNNRETAYADRNAIIAYSPSPAVKITVQVPAPTEL